MPTPCDNDGMCLLQQQLMAESLIAFSNLVTTTKNQDNEFLKATSLATLAAFGGKAPTLISADTNT